jgi:hypothetical protein
LIPTIKALGDARDEKHHSTMWVTSTDSQFMDFSSLNKCVDPSNELSYRHVNDRCTWNSVY